MGSVKRDNVCLMVALPNAPEPFDEPAHVVALLHASDLDALWIRLKIWCACATVEDFESGYGSSGIYDNNGYLLPFGRDAGRSAAEESPDAKRV